MLRYLLSALFLVALLSNLSSQMALPAEEGLFLRRSAERIIIDGKVDEAAWFSGRSAENFWENFPSDSTRCEQKTEIYMTYDDEHLYIAAKCYAMGKNYVVPSLRRDYRAGGSDNLTFLLDPFRDRTNAFVFGMNPYGVMREALISNGGESPADWLGAWDNKWRGESAIFDDYWSCEIAIPFSSIRFPEGENKWYFNSYRFDTQSNTRSTWQPIPQNQIIMSLAYMGNMEWEEAPQNSKRSISLIPYVTGSTAKDFEEGTPSEQSFGIGGDAKVSISSGLNLDLTINPDFSQVEVDRQVINTSRFEIFFPEQRQFFLENADLFARFGDDRANPFFSRRIGVAQDTAGSNFSNPIYFGARLSGKIGNDWRVGLLNTQTANEEAAGLPSYNYTVAAVQKKVFARSNVGAIFVNKETFAEVGEEFTEDFQNYNRVFGLDYNLASADNRYTGKAYFHHSFTPDQRKRAYSHGARLDFRNRNVSWGIEQRTVGEGFDAEVGFVPRRNYTQINPRAELFFYPEKGIVNRHGPRLRSRFLWTPGEGYTDHGISLGWDVQFKSNASLRAGFFNEYIYLLEDFDPSRTDATPLPGEQGYNYTRFFINYRSNNQRQFFFNLNPSVGQFFNGYRYGINSSFTLRYQPLGQIAMTVNYNYIDLPEPYAQTGLFLIGPRIDLTFSKSVFLTTFVQYNNQAENVNINARLQWRFAPVSDFFLVYTDNYNSMDWNVKTRALVAKVTYWLNT
ncbi:MAG: DUF5916 domain-containing protein [Bacteroidota bacterium]